MNRRDLFQRVGVATIGTIATLIGIQPRKAKALGLRLSDMQDDFPVHPGALPRETIMLSNFCGEPLRLWLNRRFYVDLPENRYTDTVCVDWIFAKERKNLYVARCRVCPELGEPWEVLSMKRVDG